MPGDRSEGKRRRRVARYAVVFLGLLVVVVGLAAIKGGQIYVAMAAGKQAGRAGPPPETVSTASAERQEWAETLDSVGSVATTRGVSIGNDAPGIVWRIYFESGGSVRAGEPLLELDARVERAQLASARARLELARTNAVRSRALIKTKAVAEAQLEGDEATLAAASADVDTLAAQIERKIVRAPFAGKLGIRLVNLGQYLPSGTPITVLEATEATYVDFALPQQDLGRVAVGMPVRVTLDGRPDAAASASAEGRIFTIDPAVDATSRNLRLRAVVPARDEGLRPGMFVRVTVVRPGKMTVVAVPATAVVHASFGDSLFLVEEGRDALGQPAKVVRQQFVRLGPARGDYVAVTEGLAAGQEVVVAGAFKLRNGSRVVVSNEVKPGPELAPRPPNR